MSSTPSLGLLDSLRFVYDVPTFLAAGRKLGPVWRFRFAGSSVSDATA